jgi:hypothetical protein
MTKNEHCMIEFVKHGWFGIKIHRLKAEGQNDFNELIAINQLAGVMEY